MKQKVQIKELGFDVLCALVAGIVVGTAYHFLAADRHNDENNQALSGYFFQF